MPNSSRISIWSPEYNVSVSTIDNQHQRLFVMLRQLDDSIAHGQATFNVEPLWRSLREYAAYHFRYEEQLMEQSRYPEVRSHCEWHRRLMEQLEELQRDYKSANLGVGSQLGDVIGHWLLDHISAEDRKLGRFLDPAHR